MAYRCAKTYPHSLGLSAVFRQWRAKSHCAKWHGYALAFRMVFEADQLDDNGWVIDFGALKPIKAALERMFDHKLLVAQDDPERDFVLEAQIKGMCDLTLVERTGAEAFAELMRQNVQGFLEREKHAPRVRLVEVTCWEHEGNSATVSA